MRPASRCAARHVCGALRLRDVAKTTGRHDYFFTLRSRGNAVQILGGGSSIVLVHRRVLLARAACRHPARVERRMGDRPAMSARIPPGAASVGLPDGRVLIAGGEIDGAPSARVAFYDPSTGLWSPGSDLIVPRTGHAMSLLKDGRVLIAGGTTASGPTFDIEIYNPTTASSVHGGDMTLPRFGHAAATLRDGRVLIVGGSDGASPLSGAEIFDPATGLSAGVAAMSTAAGQCHGHDPAGWPRPRGRRNRRDNRLLPRPRFTIRQRHRSSAPGRCRSRAAATWPCSCRATTRC